MFFSFDNNKQKKNVRLEGKRRWKQIKGDNITNNDGGKTNERLYSGGGGDVQCAQSVLFVMMRLLLKTMGKFFSPSLSLSTQDVFQLIAYWSERPKSVRTFLDFRQNTYIRWETKQYIIKTNHRDIECVTATDTAQCNTHTENGVQLNRGKTQQQILRTFRSNVYRIGINRAQISPSLRFHSSNSSFSLLFFVFIRCILCTLRCNRISISIFFLSICNNAFFYTSRGQMKHSYFQVMGKFFPTENNNLPHKCAHKSAFYLFFFFVFFSTRNFFFVCVSFFLSKFYFCSCVENWCNH